MLTAICNAEAVGKESISVPYSILKHGVAKLLETRGFVAQVDKKNRKINKSNRSQPCLELTLKYNNKIPAMSGFKKISKPGQRMYLSYSKIGKVKQGHGMSIISSSKGLVTDREAKYQKVGGEVLCEVW